MEKFGRGPCWVRIFGSVLMSVEDINPPDHIPGVVMPYGRLVIGREPVDGVDEVV